MNNYRKLDSYCDYKYEITVTNIETEFGKAFVIKLLHFDVPDVITYESRYISFNFDEIETYLDKCVKQFESFVDGLDYTFDERMNLLKFDTI